MEKSLEELNPLRGKHLLLASASPRRRELLGELNAEMRLAHVVEVDETYPTELDPMEVPAFLSRKKAEAYKDSLAPHEVLVAADTVVLSDGKVLGKPHGKAGACAMLRELSGRWHKVVTGVTLATSERLVTFSEVTEVEFAPLTDDEIRFYVERYIPLDKAGAYGIQEWIGYIGVKGIRGDYYNVMVLPLHSLYRHLKSL